ncbi:MAG TPA: hypothetical protein VG457_16890 [Planctomycetota bacterium]|nr:hypothetical protein [Planctomycetota bacterium]
MSAPVRAWSRRPCRRTTALLAVVLAGLAPAPAGAQDQQLGARTKAMGGSYTAFQDDPLLVWLNPAGIATQPDQLSIAYQTYAAYPRHSQGSLNQPAVFSVQAEPKLPSPSFIPSYLGLVYQLGDAASPTAIGIGLARPITLTYSMDQILSPQQSTFQPKFQMDESFSRFRVALGRDFALRDKAEDGLLTRFSVGLGADVGYEEWDFKRPPGDPTGNENGSSIALGYGGGVLVDLYEDDSLLTLQLGAAYQSPVHFKFDISPQRSPAFDMPQQVNVGATVYFHKPIPLRLTFDTQWIGWASSAEKPFVPGQNGFRNSMNYSVGAEYQLKLTDVATLYPRAGYRRFQAPWSDRSDLPATGDWKLVLDTKASNFNIATFGLGVSWKTDTGKIRSVDLGGDYGGDSYNVALGYTHEF